MKKINLKPITPDLKVHLEDGSGFLHKDGQEVAHTAYWRRRIQDGDVVEVEVVKPESEKKGGAKNAG